MSGFFEELGEFFVEFVAEGIATFVDNKIRRRKKKKEKEKSAETEDQTASEEERSTGEGSAAGKD